MDRGLTWNEGVAYVLAFVSWFGTGLVWRASRRWRAMYFSSMATPSLKPEDLPPPDPMTWCLLHGFDVHEHAGGAVSLRGRDVTIVGETLDDAIAQAKRMVGP